MSLDTYIQSLAIAGNTIDFRAPGGGSGSLMGETTGGAVAKPEPLSANLKAAVDAGTILSFVNGLTEQEREDVLFSVQLAHRAATREIDPKEDPRQWYERYLDVLQRLGWTAEQRAFSAFDQQEGEFRMDKAALALITAVATQNQLVILKEAVAALEKLADNDNAVRLFDFHTSTDGGGNFQIGAVQKGEHGAISMALGSFYFRSHDARRRFLFFAWGKNEVEFWTAAQKLTLNTALYGQGRETVKRKLGKTFTTFVAELKI